MTRLDQKIQGDMETHVFKCYCGEDSYLVVTKDSKDDQLYISITKHPTRLVERLKLAWKSLRGLEFTTTNEVIIDGSDADNLALALTSNQSEKARSEEAKNKQI